ncbi:hypothetical protein PFISCL1PPCAC_22291, partial [Pristionchus fissidentatus]
MASAVKRVKVDDERDEESLWDGEFRFKVSHREYCNGAISDEIEIRGMQWRLKVVRINDGFSLYLVANLGSRSNAWTCEGKAELMLMGINDNVKPPSKTIDFLFYSKRNACGFEEFFRDPNFNRDFTETMGLIVGARIAVKKVQGRRPIPQLDFSSPSEFSDVTFIVEGKKIHAHKQYLSVHSKILHRMLSVDENTKNLSEIELPDVKYEEFIDLLYCIYPSSKKITVLNVGYLLKLARRFEINVILKAAIDFMLSLKSDIL